MQAENQTNQTDCSINFGVPTDSNKSYSSPTVCRSFPLTQLTHIPGPPIDSFPHKGVPSCMIQSHDERTKHELQNTKFTLRYLRLRLVTGLESVIVLASLNRDLDRCGCCTLSYRLKLAEGPILIRAKDSERKMTGESFSYSRMILVGLRIISGFSDTATIRKPTIWPNATLHLPIFYGMLMPVTVNIRDRRTFVLVETDPKHKTTWMDRLKRFLCKSL